METVQLKAASPWVCVHFTLILVILKNKNKKLLESHVSQLLDTPNVYFTVQTGLSSLLCSYLKLFSGAVMTPCEQPPGPPVTRLACERDGSLTEGCD